MMNETELDDFRLTPLEDKIVEQIECDHLTGANGSTLAKAYHDLMEGIRSRIDAEMLAFTFEQTKIQMHRQEQVVKAAAAQGLTHAG